VQIREHAVELALRKLRCWSANGTRAAIGPVIGHLKEDGHLGRKAPWAARRRCLILRWRLSTTGPDRHRAAVRGEFRREYRG
jgi:hypothetical protein